MANANKISPVVLGGVSDFNSLAQSSEFSNGQSTGRLALYTHSGAVLNSGSSQLAAIGNAWKTYSGGVAEFGLFYNGFFTHEYQQFWVQHGLTVTQANVDVNVNDPNFMSEWTAFVTAGRSAGVASLAPVSVPLSAAVIGGNFGSLGSGFYDPLWNTLRAAAQYGGGLAIYLTPNEFAEVPAEAQTFVEQEIRWANYAGIRSSVIIAADGAGIYLQAAKTLEATLLAAGAIPSQWVIEPGALNAIGPEASSNSAAGVADWFAKNAPVSVPAANGAVQVENADGSSGAILTGSANGLTLVSSIGGNETQRGFEANGTPLATTGVPKNLQIVLGGVNGFLDLANPANFTDAIASGRLGLYTHSSAVGNEGNGELPQIAATWNVTGPGVAEFGLSNPNFFTTTYQTEWVANGLSVSEADVDFTSGDPNLMSKWIGFVDAGRAAGVGNMAIIFSPNNAGGLGAADVTQRLGSGWMDPQWSFLRQAALYGGGIAIDTPPHFFLESGPAYRNFIEAEIRWGNAAGLRTSVIISPDDSGQSYLDNAKEYLAALASADALPSQWVVESYAQNADGTFPTDGNYPSPIGSENTPNTEAAVADWFAHNAPVAVDTGPGIVVIQNADGTYGATIKASADAMSSTVTTNGVAITDSYPSTGLLSSLQAADGSYWLPYVDGWLIYSASGIYTNHEVVNADGSIALYTATDQPISTTNAAGTWEDVVADNFTIAVASGNYAGELGNNDILTGGAACTVNIIGDNDSASVGAGSSVGVVRGINTVINESASTTNTLNGVGLTVNGSNNAIFGGAQSNFKIMGNSNNIGLGSTSYASELGDGNILTGGANSSVTIVGNYDTAALGSGSAVEVTRGTGNVVNETAGTVVALSNVALTVNGSNDTISGDDQCSIRIAGGSDTVSLGGGGQASLIGNGNALTSGLASNINIVGYSNTASVGSGSYVGVVTGTGNVINESTSTTNTLSNVGVTIYGANNSISGGDQSSYTVVGNANTIGQGSGDTTTEMGDGNTLTSGAAATVNIVGSDNVAAVGSGSYVGVIRGAGNAVNETSGTVNTLNNVGLTITGSSNAIYGGMQSNFAVIGHSNTIGLGSNSSATVIGAGNVLTSGAGSSININGNNDTAAVGAGSYVGVVNGTGTTINESTGTANLLAKIGVTVNGSNNNISGGADSNINIVGASNTIGLGSGSYAGLIGDANVLTSGPNTDVNIVGNNDTVAVGSGSGIGVVRGTGHVIHESASTTNANDNVDVTIYGLNNGLSGTDQCSITAVGDSNTIVLGDSSSGIEQGSGDVLTAGTGANVNMVGSNDTATVGKGSYVGVVSGTGNVVNESGGNANTLNNVGLTLNGANNSISVGTGSTGSVNGSNNNITFSANGDLTVSGGGNSIATFATTRLWLTATNGLADQVTAVNEALGQTAADGSATGIFVDADVQLNITGYGNGVMGSASSTINLTGSNNAIYNGNAANQTGNVAPIEQITVNGASNSVFLGGTQTTVTDNSNALTLVISGSGTGATNGLDVIRNFGAARGGVVDLVGSAGGYKTAAAAAQAIVSDGHSGSLLQLGTGSSIDFLGALPSSLTAANFHIG